MRQATSRYIEATSALERMYRACRRRPAPVRAPLRALGTPLWTVVARLVLSRSRERVVAGPFRGMALELAPVSRRHLLSYVLGTSELELHGVIERIIAHRYATIVNAGAADGYYAVGLAMRSPGSKIVAFEAQERLHAALARVAEVNGVAGRIAYRGFCDEQSLRRELAASGEPTLVFMDIEGAEQAVLDPESTLELAAADIMVETHDAYIPGCTAALIARFSPTHEIERYTAKPRALADFPAGFLPMIPTLMPRLAVDLMDERREGRQEWLYMIARRGAQTARSA